ncbi:hypothetical protein [Streptomyces sannanensis]|uniref:alpha/beta fold hydrolase n=1 Tax=Streptomyces sannanensis TaxID=285536 RepID=UPI0031EF5503
MTGPRPTADALRALEPPTLILLAGRSRAHDVRKVAARAAELLPDAECVTLPGATHHTLPLHGPAEPNVRIAEFLIGTGRP